jgi:transcriptional regulator GlxA family with amidase domain
MDDQLLQVLHDELQKERSTGAIAGSICVGAVMLVVAILLSQNHC